MRSSQKKTDDTQRLLGSVRLYIRHNVTHWNKHYLLPTPTAYAEVMFSTGVCLSVYPQDISKTAAARITKLDIETFHR